MGYIKTTEFVEIIDNLPDANKLVEIIISDAMAKREKAIEEIIRQYAEPKIKGEITPGKLRWRGIALASKTGSSDLWVIQRGKQIGPLVRLEMPNK